MLADEPGFLRAFYLSRASIQAAAMNAYKRERKGSYELAAKDFLHQRAPGPRKMMRSAPSMKVSLVPSGDEQGSTDVRALARSLARYREPSHARSLVEVLITVVPFMGLYR